VNSEVSIVLPSLLPLYFRPSNAADKLLLPTHLPAMSHSLFEDGARTCFSISGA
jgi:hypothetical protein